MDFDSDNLFIDSQGTEYSVTGENEVNLDSDNQNSGKPLGEDCISSLLVNVGPENELFRKDPRSWTTDDLVGKEFRTIGAAEEFYRLYSKRVGFGFRRDNQERRKDDGKIIMRRWVCSREGARTVKNLDRLHRKREPRMDTRCNCKALFIVRYRDHDCLYRVSTFKPNHNHPVAPPEQVHFFRCNRQITTGQAMEIRTMKEAGIRTAQIMDFMVTALGGFNNVGFTPKDLYNFISTDQERTRRLNTDAEATLAYFTALADNDPGLFVIYKVDEENRLNRLFWADSRSKQDYAQFGDVLVIDSTYKTNAFKMPLVEFVGVNNHHSTVVFGCALLCDESIDAYIWCFKFFLDAMGRKAPISVITDGDRAIASALATVMPQSRHRLCSWHLMRNARCMSHDKDFLADFRKCMLNHQTVESFEDTWAAFRNKYCYVNSEWMDELYERKEKWAEPFFKGIFCGGMTTNQRCESTNAYMNRFLNCDLSLYSFVKQHYRAMFRLRENVLHHDFTNLQGDTILQTHLKSIEKSAAKFYSRSIFLKVREEMKKETRYTPDRMVHEAGVKKIILSKFGNKDGKTTVVSVGAHNSLGCSCGRYESFGWPCRHMFCAMKALNLDVIPPELLKDRWAKMNIIGSSGSWKGSPNKTTGNNNELRYGSLIAKAHQLCNIAAKTGDAYLRVMSMFENTISLMPIDSLSPPEPSTKERKGAEGTGPTGKIIRDPDVVRTKGCSQSEGKSGKSKKRKCGNCKEAGHYRSNCPKNKLEDDVRQGGKTNFKEEVESVDTSDDDNIFL